MGRKTSTMIRVLLVCVICVVYVQAGTTTTHKPRPTHEPNEHEGFRFAYEPNTHKMVVVSGNQCYIFTLSAAERVAVHSDAGIRTLELKFLGMLDTATKTAVTQEQVGNKLWHTCGRHVAN